MNPHLGLKQNPRDVMSDRTFDEGAAIHPCLDQDDRRRFEAMPLKAHAVEPVEGLRRPPTTRSA